MTVDALLRVWKPLIAIVTVAVSLAASAHVVLRKRDSRAAVGWLAFIWFVPMVGALGYAVLGVNRMRRRAEALHMPEVRPRPAGHSEARHRPDPQAEAEHLRPFVHLADAVVRRPLVQGNAVQLLPGGASAYPAMIAAIDGAERSVTLLSYIFDLGEVGDLFVEALARANRRGVEVRVLIDAVGARYKRPPAHRRLRVAGVRTELFLDSLAPAWLPFVNLRNHRKILVVDGRVGFTGGLNIRDEFAPGPSRPEPCPDLHARFEGPVVAHLQSIFAEDWLFATGDDLDGDAFYPELAEPGPVLARGISDGPDEDFECLRWVLLGAIASARRSIQIVTPYFLPEPALISSLNVAALRKVEVDIVLPERGNLRLVDWAQDGQLWQVLTHACRVWKSAPPFDHTKLMVVDDCWTLLGSANWDARSLRLNFEANVECHDAALGAQAAALVRERISRSRRVTLAHMDARPVAVKLRDGVARLFSPYL